jgi:hypothetical protein
MSDEDIDALKDEESVALDEAEPDALNDEESDLDVAAAVAEATSEAGYLEDFISKLWVRDTPEEREAVQVIARRQVEELSARARSGATPVPSAKVAER